MYRVTVITVDGKKHVIAATTMRQLLTETDELVTILTAEAILPAELTIEKI